MCHCFCCLFPIQYADFRLSPEGAREFYLLGTQVWSCSLPDVERDQRTRYAKMYRLLSEILAWDNVACYEEAKRERKYLLSSSGSTGRKRR